MAPLAATIAATVAVGVGVALARAGRDRRESHRDGANERQFALLPGERLADGMVRMALGQVDLALELLGGGGGALDEHAVHEIRKALKRLRALLRLLEEELGAKTYARENAALRKTAARLAGARDAEVMLATLERLIARHPRKLRRRGGVVRLRAQLAAEHERMERHTLGDEATRALVLEELRAFRARVLEWQLRDRDGVRLVEPGLAGVYRQGRRRYRRAAHARRDRVRAMHEWRKRVKDLRYAAEMLQRRDPARRAGLGAPAGSTVRAPGHGAGREAARLRRLAKRADALGEMLGEEHDLALLAELIGAQRRSGKGKRSGRSAALRPRIGRRTRKLLLKLIARRRRRLRKRALHEGERLYAAGPKRFLRGVRAAYASGWQSAS